ncbi:MAG: 2-dehydropantoate 2-reductase [Chthoniobacterales bacterium]
MRIAIVGAGAIGTYYGAKLAAGGNDVRFLVRTGFEAVKENGLRITGPGEDVRVRQVNAYRSTNEIGTCDLVVVAIKTTSNELVGELLPPLIDGQTTVLTLQNGLGNEELLAEVFGADRIIGGLCFICLCRSAPGVVHRYDHGHINIGEYGRPPQDRTRAIAGAFQKCGIKCGVIDDLLLERWRKLVWNIPFNGLTILAGGIDTAAILGDADLNRAAVQLMHEVIAGANRCGFQLETSAVEEQMRRTRTMGKYKPSTLVDFENGKPLEIEAIWGEPLRRALAAGAEMPRLLQMYAALKSLDRLEQAQ